MIRSFRINDIDIDDIVVVSNNPVMTRRMQQVKAVRSGDIRSLIRLMARTRVCVLGGGGLIKDGSCVAWLGHILLFKILGAQTMCYAIGATTLHRRLDILFARIALNHFVDFITVRDHISKGILRDVGVRKEIIVSADPAVLFKAETDMFPRLAEGRRPIIGLCLKDFDHEDVAEARGRISRDMYVRNIAEECDDIVRRSHGSLLMVPCTEADAKDIREIHSTMRQRSNVVPIDHTPTPSEFFSMASVLDVLISERLHPLILGSLLSLPLVAIPYSAKVRSYMKEIGATLFCVEYHEIGSGKLGDKVAEALEKNEEIRRRTGRSLNDLKLRAQVSIDIIRSLVGSG
jgi:polysaccharide pyruvyl transferase WcaK-like protein